MFAAIAAVATLVFIGVASLVGMRLLWLARQTRGLPEFVLGFGLLVIVGFGYPLALTGRALLDTQPEAGRWLLALSAIPVSLGWSGVWIFIWRVFRPDHALARAATFSVLALMVVLAIASMHRTLTLPDAAAIDFSSLVYLGTSLLAMLGNLWGMVESLAYHAKMRRRLAVGLGDPVVANRFLLWAVVMGSSCVSTSFPVVSTLMSAELSQSPVVLMGSAVAGLVCSAALWLAFLPPQAYVARLRTA